MRIFANDHDDKFPWKTETTNGGTIGLIESPEVFRHFLVASNELSTAKILACPADPNRLRTHDFSQFSNSNLSYFVGVDSDESMPQTLLSGDRHISGGTLSNNFMRTVKPTWAVGWTPEMHQGTGNIAMGDGSVMPTTSASLQQLFSSNTLPFMRLAIP